MTLTNDELRQFAQRHGREYVRYCSRPKNVWSGEEHTDRYDHDAQVDFIERFRPTTVLHEFMGIHIYDPRTDSLSLRRPESPNTIAVRKDDREKITDLFKDLAREYGFLLVGCDLTPNEREYLIQQRGGRRQSEEEIRRKLERMNRPMGPFGVDVLDLAEPERHQEMASVYQEHRGREGIVLMVTGLQHVRGEQKPDWEASDIHALVMQPDYGVIENRYNVRKLVHA